MPEPSKPTMRAAAAGGLLVATILLCAAVGLGLGALAVAPYAYAPPVYYPPPPAYYPPPPAYYPPPVYYAPPGNMPPGPVIY